MYSMFDLFFDTPPYAPVYVISDTEMKELKKTQHQEELDVIQAKKERLEAEYKTQVKHFENREKELRKELRELMPSKN